MNSAGGNGLTWELPVDVWRRVIEVNLIGCATDAGIKAAVGYIMSAISR